MGNSGVRNKYEDCPNRINPQTLQRQSSATLRIASSQAKTEPSKRTMRTKWKNYESEMRVAEGKVNHLSGMLQCDPSKRAMIADLKTMVAELRKPNRLKNSSFYRQQVELQEIQSKIEAFYVKNKISFSSRRLLSANKSAGHSLMKPVQGILVICVMIGFIQI